MFADTILTHIDEVFCPKDPGHPLRGSEMNQADILKDGFIAIKDGKIAAVGEGEAYAALVDAHTEVSDCRGSVATPGLIDAHTHLVYGGSRENEFSDKLNGVTYLEILERGGGIHSTVQATRESDLDTLYEKTKKLAEHMLFHGVTTVEAKSGYGLNWETEKKMMEVVRKLNEEMPMDFVSTFMAAHAVPKAYKERPDDYVEEIIQMMPEVVADNLAEYCDVFCEKGVFTASQSRKILEAAKAHGLKLRIHADEIESIGGCDVAAELGAASAEHLMVIRDEDIQKLADAGVIGNLLPGTTFSLMTDTFAPARKMMERGMAITLCTDSNPGSCPMANLQFIMQLGCFAYKMTPIEVYNAVTINAAYSVGRADSRGSFDVGKNADITLFDAHNLEYPLYFFATNLCKAVYKDGVPVVLPRTL